MYDMYPAPGNWPVMAEHDRHHHTHAHAAGRRDDAPVQESMNRRDNGGGPTR